MSVERLIEHSRRALQGVPEVAEVDLKERDSLRVCLQDGSELVLIGFRPGEFESRGVQGMYAHRAATYEDLARKTKARAGELWAQDRVKEAEMLKELAKEYFLQGEEARRRQAEERARFD